KGDLDAITMKALEKDRARRYGTPSELMTDIRRFMSHEPVQARPAGTVYRLSKYIRKHRGGVAVVSVLFLVLLAFTANTWIQARRIAEERDRANEESDRATRLAARKTRAIEFLTDMFKPSAEAIAGGKRVTALDVLDNAARHVVAPNTEDPISQDELRVAVASGYRKMGLYGEAQALLAVPDMRATFEAKRREQGEAHVETLVAEVFLARALWIIGDLGEAEVLVRDALRRRAHATDVDRIDVRARQVLAEVLTRRGQYLEAEQLLKQALPLAQQIDRSRPPSIPFLMLSLATVLARQGRMTDAENVRTRALAVAAETTEPGGPQRANFEYGSACVLALEGRREEALNTLALALEHRLSLDEAVRLSEDDDFESLQHDARFRALVAK